MGKSNPRAPGRAWSLWCFLWVAGLFLYGFGPPTLIDRDVDPAQRLTVGQLRQMVLARTPPPDVSARSVLVYDLDADRELILREPDRPVPPASLTKLMTALLVLERGDLGASVTVRPEDLVGGATMGLQAGEVRTVEELLRGMLMASANDAAMALARHHSGQTHVFVQRVTLRAHQMGLTSTYFANPTGFDAPGHTSSARDLLTLTKALWEYPLFREIVGTPTATVAGRSLRNTNQLLGRFPGAVGVKTGTTDAAGESLVAAVERDGRLLFLVVLGSQDRYADVQTLYRQATTFYGWARPAPQPPTRLDQVEDGQGNRWWLAPMEDPPELFLAVWERLWLRGARRLDLPTGPWSPGLEVGRLVWYVGGTVVGGQRLKLQ